MTRAADEAVRHAGEGASRITVSSGISPSGRVHLGNLRELLTVHFVAEELRRRGLPARHLHVWDDYDRFRKVPIGVDPSWSEHIGRPLSKVPDPDGCHDSWAEHFKQPVRDALHAMGVDMEEISQTERYEAGHYKDAVLQAVAARDAIEAVLARHRTKAAVPAEPENEQEAEALADSVAADDDEPLGAGDLARFPYKPYCRDCGRDTVTLTSYDDETTELSYTCDFNGYSGSTVLSSDFEGKLVWKVDWPMRWAFEHVDFEPAGMDHATPGSSFTVGHSLVEDIFGMPRPAWFGYGFVGFAGVQKMSSSAGGAPTAEDALRILEAPILRWLYVRRNPRQAFNIDFGAEVVRLYDEWDALGRKAADPGRRDAQVLAHERAVATSTAGVLPSADHDRAVPPALLRRRHHQRRRGPDQSHRRRGHRGPRAAAQPGVELDTRVRRSHHGPRDSGRRASRRTERGRAPLAGPAPRPPAGHAGARADHSAGLRRTQARSRPGSRRCPDRPDQGRPEGVLQAALQPAGRR